MGNVFSCCVHEEKVPEQKPVVRGSSNRKIVTEQVIEQEKKSSEAQFNKKSVASKSMSKPQEEEPPFEYAPALENKALNSEASVLSDQTSEDAVQPDHFEKHKVGPAHKIIGKGAYGTVYLVTRKDDLDKTPLAMKEIIKANMKQKNQMVFLQRERDMLVTFKSPFIVDLKCCMQDEGKVYFVFEFMAGGDLYHHLKASRRFGEQRARFYAAQLVLAIEYLHKLGIIYRSASLTAGT